MRRLKRAAVSADVVQAPHGRQSHTRRDADAQVREAMSQVPAQRVSRTERIRSRQLLEVLQVRTTVLTTSSVAPFVAGTQRSSPRPTQPRRRS